MNDLTGLTFFHDLKEEHVDVTPLIKQEISFTFTVSKVDMPLLRTRMLGLPACPVKHKRFSRKTFKKALMANRISRNKAECICRQVAERKGHLSYVMISKTTYCWIFE